MDYMDPDVCCPQKVGNIKSLSLTSAMGGCEVAMEI